MNVILTVAIDIYTVVLDAVDPFHIECLSIAMTTFLDFMEQVEEVTLIILLCHHLKHRKFLYNSYDTH